MSLDASGKVVSQFRTNPYAALHVAVNDAGNIWTLGVDYDAKGHKADYNILREYSQDGRILTTALPRSSFATSLEPATNKGGLTGRNLLRAHGPNMAAFMAQTHEWIEVSPAGRVISRVKVQLPSRAGYRAPVRWWLRCPMTAVCSCSPPDSRCASSIPHPELAAQ